MTPEVRDQMIEAHTIATRLWENAAAPATEAAAAVGRLGMIYHVYSDLEYAADCYSAARAKDPQEFRWAYLHGVVAAKAGDVAASDAALGRALTLRPDDLPALVRGAEVALGAHRLDDAKALVARALAVAPDSARVRFIAAQTAQLDDDWAGALGHLTIANESQPAASQIIYALGIAYRKVGDHQRSNQLLARVPHDVREQTPLTFDDPLLRDVKDLGRGVQAYEHRGLKAAARGNYAVAVAELRQVVSLDPHRLEARHNLALALLRLGHNGKAMAEITEILRLNPDYSHTLVLLASIKTARGDAEEAETLLHRALVSNPTSARAHTALVDLLRSQGRDTEATEVLARARDLGLRAEESER